MEQNSEYTPKPVENKKEEKIPLGEKTTKQDNSIFRQIQEPMTRRNFLKIATKAAIGLSTGHLVNKEIDGMLAEYEKEKTTKGIEIEYSDGLTKLYEEVHKMPEKEKEYTNLEVGKNLAEKLFEYPKKIRDSNKQNFDEFAKGLSQEEFDDLIIGKWDGPEPTDEKSAYIVEELIKNNKKISAIGLEYLSYTDPIEVKTTEKFNRGEISSKEMPVIVSLENEALLELAQKNSIKIIGLEKDKSQNFFDRLKEISERVGEINREKKKNDIVVTHIGQGHTTIDGWRYFDPLLKLQRGTLTLPMEKIALENNYTIEESLEKDGFKSITVQIDDWKKLIYAHDNVLAKWYEDLPEKDKKSFYEFCENSWRNYSLEEDDEGVYPYPNGKGKTFSAISNVPTKFPEKPPILNGYKLAYDNPYLAEILRKTNGIGDVAYYPDLILKVKDLPIVEVDKNTGNVTKMYLPKQAKNK